MKGIETTIDRIPGLGALLEKITSSINGPSLVESYLCLWRLTPLLSLQSSSFRLSR